jgi:DNA-binding transcriptional ArsR family regulator
MEDPSSTSSEVSDNSLEPLVLDIDDDAADEFFEALTSKTAREVLSRVYQDPATPSDVADTVDTSVQNAKYHLEKFESIDLIKPVDIRYSSRGNEMTVYGPTKDSILISVGRGGIENRFGEKLKRLLGGALALIVAIFVIAGLLRQNEQPPPDNPMSAPANPTPSSTPSPTRSDTIQNTTQAVIEGSNQIANAPSPGVFIFIGGVIVIVMVLVWDHYDKSLSFP